MIYESTCSNGYWVSPLSLGYLMKALKTSSFSTKKKNKSVDISVAYDKDNKYK